VIPARCYEPGRQERPAGEDGHRAALHNNFHQQGTAPDVPDTLPETVLATVSDHCAADRPTFSTSDPHHPNYLTSCPRSVPSGPLLFLVPETRFLFLFPTTITDDRPDLRIAGPQKLLA
jgi:hypothetical protein